MASNHRNTPRGSRRELIDRLSSASKFRRVRLARDGWLWLLASIAWVVAIGAYLDPIRPTSIDQLIGEPRFSLEMMLGALAALVSTRAAFALAVPSAANPRVIGLALLGVGLWLTALVVTFVTPSLEPSMFGKREACEWEAYLLSVPPIVLGVLLQKRGAILNPIAASAMIGVSAGLLPALFMQMACMVDPWHSLSHHAGPMLVVTMAATLLSWAYGRLDRLRQPRS